jgi:hypothetical protein
VIDQRDSVYLVYRISGAQDKMAFFEIYRVKPEFDACGSTQTPAVAKEPYLAHIPHLLKGISALSVG